MCFNTSNNNDSNFENNRKNNIEKKSKDYKSKT